VYQVATKQSAFYFDGIVVAVVVVVLLPPGPNVTIYELFHVNYDAQLSSDKIFTIYGIIHRSI
jgi:hypothetical protein